jgi:hypothetical protein
LGEFDGAAPLLPDIAEVGHGLEEIAITGYPESHAFISDETAINRRTSQPAAPRRADLHRSNPP